MACTTPVLRTMAIAIFLSLCGCSWSRFGTELYDADNASLIGLPMSALIHQHGAPEFHFTDPEGAGEIWGYMVTRSQYWFVFGGTRGSGVLIRFAEGKISSVNRVDASTFDEVATRGWDYANLVARN